MERSFWKCLYKPLMIVSLQLPFRINDVIITSFGSGVYVLSSLSGIDYFKFVPLGGI